MEVSKKFIAYRRNSPENITSELGVKLRVNRSIQSESAFGVLKEDRHECFHTRGNPNVRTELLLLCFGCNVNKLHAKIRNERCGTSLHELKPAAQLSQKYKNSGGFLVAPKFFLYNQKWRKMGFVFMRLHLIMKTAVAFTIFHRESNRPFVLLLGKSGCR